MFEEAAMDENFSLQVILKCKATDNMQPETGIKVDSQARTVSLKVPEKDDEVKNFKLHQILIPNKHYEQFHAETIVPFVKRMLDGKNCVFFSYGLTKSGSSILMGKYEELQLPEMIPMTIKAILEAIEGKETIKLKMSFYEIYMEKIRDLLVAFEEKPEPQKHNKQIKIRQSKKGIRIQNLTQLPFSNLEQFHTYLQKGKQKHIIEHTKMSTHRSRSTEILTLCLQNEGQNLGSLSFVELSTHERQKIKTAPFKDEMIKPTVGRLFQVLRSISEGKKFVPYRDSVLTRVLQKSLKNTIFMGNIIPSLEKYSENLQTLRVISSIYKEVAPQQ